MRDSKMGGGGGFSLFSVFGMVEKYSFLSSTSAFSIREEASWQVNTNKVNIHYTLLKLT